MSKYQTTIKPDRIGTQPKPKYYINRIVMPPYCKLIIKRLAVRYSHDVLIVKLSELQFCSLKTALEVLFEE